MRKQILLLLLSIVLLLILGCMPRANIDATSVLARRPHVSSPLVLVQYTESGESSVFYSPLSEPDALISINVPALSVKPKVISTLAEGEIRTIHVESQPGGLRFRINGEPLPSLVWDDATRTELMAMLTDRGVDAEQVTGFLGLMSDLGMGLAFAMPSATASDLEVSSANVLDKQTSAQLVATARTVQPVQTIALAYDETGIPAGQLPASFEAIGLTLDTLALSPDTIEFIAKQKIERFSITTTGSGLIINVNDNDLLYIEWTEDELARMLEVFVDLSTVSEQNAWLMGYLLVPEFRPILLSLRLRVELEFDF